jgi:BirA family biotin operon repressor/biotin-[acetyl-CoA-carboxylase] ligase
LALAAGLAVAEGLETFGVAAGIKWPNDVWIDGKKVCGVLAEAGADFVVVGIGVNVNVVAFPEDLSSTATSLRLETGVAANRAEVLLAILRRLEYRRHQIGESFAEVLDAVRSRCVLTGKEVALQAADGRREGRVEGIGDGGELLLHGPGGLERLWQADEVRLR